MTLYRCEEMLRNQNVRLEPLGFAKPNSCHSTWHPIIWVCNTLRCRSTLRLKLPNHACPPQGPMQPLSWEYLLDSCQPSPTSESVSLGERKPWLSSLRSQLLIFGIGLTPTSTVGNRKESGLEPPQKPHKPAETRLDTRLRIVSPLPNVREGWLGSDLTPHGSRSSGGPDRLQPQAELLLKEDGT